MNSFGYLSIWFTLILLVFPNWQLASQSPTFFHYNVEEGLPSSEVYDIHQDKKGFIWFATDHGLCRFDGYEFQTFTKEDGLSDNTVFDIREDRNGRLWLSTYSGGISYYEDGECGIHPANEAILKNLGSNYPDNLLIDTVGNMWVSSSLSNQWDPRILKIDTTNHLIIDSTLTRYQSPIEEGLVQKKLVL